MVRDNNEGAKGKDQGKDHGKVTGGKGYVREIKGSDVRVKGKGPRVRVQG